MIRKSLIASIAIVLTLAGGALAASPHHAAPTQLPDVRLTVPAKENNQATQAQPAGPDALASRTDLQALVDKAVVRAIDAANDRALTTALKGVRAGSARQINALVDKEFGQFLRRFAQLVPVCPALREAFNKQLVDALQKALDPFKKSLEQRLDKEIATHLPGRPEPRATLVSTVLSEIQHYLDSVQSPLQRNTQLSTLMREIQECRAADGSAESADRTPERRPGSENLLDASRTGGAADLSADAGRIGAEGSRLSEGTRVGHPFVTGLVDLLEKLHL